jgi:uncharacterized protein (DUF4415 family)
MNDASGKAKPFKLTKPMIAKAMRAAEERPDEENREWTQADFDRAILTRNRVEFDEWRRRRREAQAQAVAAVNDQGREDPPKRKPGQRGAQKAPTKAVVTLPLDRDVLVALKATGDGWRTRLNGLLRAAVTALKGSDAGAQSKTVAPWRDGKALATRTGEAVRGLSDDHPMADSQDNIPW